MMYALIQNGTITQVGALPRVWNDGTRDWGLGVDGAVTPEQVTALGWHKVTLTPRPDDTDTTTSVDGYDVVDGLPVQTWTARPWTPDELAAREQAAQAQARYETHESILDATAALMETAHEDGAAWVQPTRGA